MLVSDDIDLKRILTFVKCTLLCNVLGQQDMDRSRDAMVAQVPKQLRNKFALSVANY